MSSTHCVGLAVEAEALALLLLERLAARVDVDDRRRARLSLRCRDVRCVLPCSMIRWSLGSRFLAFRSRSCSACDGERRSRPRSSCRAARAPCGELGRARPWRAPRSARRFARSSAICALDAGSLWSRAASCSLPQLEELEALRCRCACIELALALARVLQALLVELERVGVRLHADLDRPARLVRVDVVERRVRRLARLDDRVDEAVGRRVVAALEATTGRARRRSGGAPRSSPPTPSARC